MPDNGVAMSILIRCVLLLIGIHLFTPALPPSRASGRSLLKKAVPHSKLYQLTPREVDALMKKTVGTPTNEKIALYSRLALGTPYRRDCLGEGAGGKCDQDPLIDFTRVDCLTFCEQTLSLAISRDYPAACRNLQKIRYHHGIVSFTSRNHFVVADWVPHNQWLLRDVTEERGGLACEEMVKTIDRRAFAASRGCTDTREFPQPQQIRIRYLPKEYLLTIQPRLRGGEIMVFITTGEGIFAAHLGFIVKKGDGSHVFRHASSIHHQVIDEQLNQLNGRVQRDRQIAGFVFLTIREKITSF